MNQSIGYRCERKRAGMRNGGRQGCGRIRRFDVGRLAGHAVFAAVVGVAGAAASIVLTLSVDFASCLSMRFSWLVFGLPLFGLVSVGLYKLLRLPVGLTTEDVVERFRSMNRISIGLAPAVLSGTFLSVLGKGSVGMEAAVLQMGASVGSLVARPFDRFSVRREGSSVLNGYAAALGMASAFSALFFAPLGSMAFVLELARFDRMLVRRIPFLLVAVFVAYGISSSVRIGDAVPTVLLPSLSWSTAEQSLLVGLCCAVVGALFAASLRLVRETVRRALPASFAVVSGGVLFVGVVLVFGLQSFGGTGKELLAGALAGDARTFDFAVKAALTVLVLGFGFKGGEIMPMFAIGALLGCSIGRAGGFSASFSAAIGMAALFAAAGRCPLAAVLMGAEIFGWAAFPFLVIAVAAAFAGSFDVGVFGRGTVALALRARRSVRAMRN